VERNRSILKLFFMPLVVCSRIAANVCIYATKNNLLRQFNQELCSDAKSKIKFIKVP
jgi:hypothetical protein